MSEMIKETCGECGGTGSVDSGGFTPWGSAIEVGCGMCDGTGQVLVKAPPQQEEEE